MKTIEVTQGINGYPEGVYTTQIFESVEEMKNAGDDLYSIYRKRDGWDFWEFFGFATCPFDMEDVIMEDAGDGYYVIKVDKDDDFEDVLDNVKQNYTCDDDDTDCKEWRERIAREIFDDLKKGYGEVFVVSYTGGVRDVFPAESVEYHDLDVYTYAIGKMNN